MNTSEQTVTEQLQALGFALHIESGPVGEVHDDWPCIAYRVRLERNGKPVITLPYSLGVGHAKVPKRWEDQPPELTTDEVCAFNTLRNNPHAQLKDKALHASFATKLAKQQKVQPKLADVMHSLLSEGACFFDAQSFEDWASELGYDTDSRKAEGIYRECDRIGRQIMGGLGAEMVSQLRETFSQY